MTIEIAVCDDQPEMPEGLGELLKQFFLENGQDYRLFMFHTPPEVFEYLQNNRIHILFMDLKFHTEDEDGMIWTRKIKDAFPKVLVLILTGYEQRCKEGYRAGAFRFMTKPLSEQEFRENMNDCMKEITGIREVWVRKRGLKFLLSVQEILFVEAFAGESRVYAKDYIFDSEQTLSSWEKELEGENFFRINKSILLPLGQIAEVAESRREVVLTDGSSLLVSRRRWADFRSSYMRYCSNSAKDCPNRMSISSCVDKKIIRL